MGYKLKSGSVFLYDDTTDDIVGIRDVDGQDKLFASQASDVDAVPVNLTVTTESGTSRTLALTDALGYIRCTSGSATTVTVPANASVAFDIGAQINIRQAGEGQVTVAPAGGVTINTPETLKTRKQHSLITLIKVAENTWDILGDLETV